MWTYVDQSSLIGRPRNEYNFVPRSSSAPKTLLLLEICGAVPCALPTVQLILKVVYCISWALPLLALVARLSIHNLLLEVLPFRIRRGFLDDDLLVVVGQLVDDIFDRFAQFEFVEFGDAIGRDGDSVVKIIE